MSEDKHLTIEELAQDNERESKYEYWIKYGCLAFCGLATAAFAWQLSGDMVERVLLVASMLAIFEGATIGWGRLYLVDAKNDQIEIARKAENVGLFISVLSTLAELAILTPLGKDFSKTIHLDFITYCVIGIALASNIYFVTQYFRNDPVALLRMLKRKQKSVEDAASLEMAKAEFRLKSQAQKEMAEIRGTIVQDALKNARANTIQIATQVQDLVTGRFTSEATDRLLADWTSLSPEEKQANLHRVQQVVNRNQKPQMAFAKDAEKITIDEVSEEPKK